MKPRNALLLLALAPLLAARAEVSAADTPVVWVSRIPLDGSGPRYESASGLPGRYRLGSLPDGGTYSGVARLFFGSASAWPAILEANRDRFPDPARVPAEADLAVPAPAAALPPAAPGLAASISLASVERRPREGVAEDADPDFREKTHLRFRLSLANETDRTIAVSFYKEFKSSFPGEPSAWFSGFCTLSDPETGRDAHDEFQTEEWIYRIEPRAVRETWLDVGCAPSGAGPEIVLRVGCLLDDAERPTSDPRDSPRILYWRGAVPAAPARAADPATDATPAPADAAASNACDRLCLDLLADAAAARRNVVFSPFSLSGALGMAALGAKGETLAQIDRIAGTGLDPDALAEREAGVRDAILEAARADGVELLLADSFWKRKGDVPLPGFERALRRGFGAEVLDFGPFPASDVNRWVSKKTKGLLPSVFDDLPAGTRLALVDAVYFKARWAVPFERKRTSDRTFYPEGGAPKTVPFMNLLAWFAYDSSDRWESLEIPYRGERFRMQIVLPRPGVTVANLVDDWISGADAPPAASAPDGNGTRRWTSYLELSLPKFSFGSAPDVAGALHRLGATDAFDPARADLSGMFPPSGEPLFLMRFAHCAVVEVDERGTTASAASGMSFGCRAPERPESLVVDRPFVFFIREPGGRILFAGAVFEP